jgi:hypothetical protein
MIHSKEIVNKNKKNHQITRMYTKEIIREHSRSFDDKLLDVNN